MYTGNKIKCGEIFIVNESYEFFCHLCENIYQNFETFQQHQHEHFYFANNLPAQQGLPNKILDSDDDDDESSNSSFEDGKFDQNSSRAKNDLSDNENVDNFQIEQIENESTNISLANSDDDDLLNKFDWKKNVQIIAEKLKLNQKDQDTSFKSQLAENDNELVTNSQDIITRDPRIYHPFRGFQCRYCERKFRIESCHRAHEKIHLNGYLKCNICEKIFQNKKAIDAHMKTHSSSKPFKCDQCDAVFIENRNLKSHLSKHTNEKSFPCQYKGGCGKFFKTQNQKKMHEDRHDPSLKFQCEMCGKKFNVRAKLTDHFKRSHLDYDERPHQCSFCYKKFVTLGSKRDHERTHTGERPYKCEVCLKYFTCRTSLKAHRKIHSSVNQYACKICGKEFKQNAGYYNHMQRHHHDEF